MNVTTIDNNRIICLLTLLTIFLCSCQKKTSKDRAVELVELKYETSNQKFDFENTRLDTLYNISPKAYADSLKKGNELDSTLAILESQIEHLSQKKSDSVGLVSAALTKERYRLLDLAKNEPLFVGWKLSGVKVKGEKSEVLSFNFDKDITTIVP